MSNETKPKVKTNFGCLTVLVLIGLGIYAAFIGPSILKPISPMVVLPAEPTGLQIGDFQITNTILATLLADVVLIALAFAAWRFYRKSEDQAPKGFLNAFEAIIEYLWNSVLGSAGIKWAKRILPIVATIFLIIFTANMVKLLPGFESLGYMKEAHGSYGYKAVELLPDVYTLDKAHPISEMEGHEGEAVAEEEHAESEAEEAHGGAATEIDPDVYYEIVPYLRGTATDINFPFALAILTVFLTQVYGVWALGPKYFEKFFQIRRLVKGGPFGVIDFGVGLLEVILEMAKILSFGFRLFGNIFAGALLLSIIGALTAVVVPAGLYIFEVFFGVIQAYVFFLLATIFISGATIAHGHEEAH